MRYCLIFILSFLAACSPKLEPNKILVDCYKIKAITHPIHAKQPGDWRDTYTEIHEPLKFYTEKHPPRATAQRTTLYVVRLGSFDKRGCQIFEAAKTYLQAFYQIPVAELDPITMSGFPKCYTRQNTIGLQLKTTVILDSLLPSLMPKNAFALIAFSLQDLFPAENWNFVFGEANLESRVGVWSMARLGDYHLNDSLYALCRQRTLNVAAHETGHILGITHCVLNECCMNGSISLQESDSQPPWLCWECLAKVCLNRNVSPYTHLSDLLDFHSQVTHDVEQIRYYQAALKLLK